MTISSGFFNSVNHDRLYDAEQFGSIFDGVINDGVYEHVGDAFNVSPNSSVNDSVIIGTGRAWFNHTWILNDSQYSVTLNPPNLVLPRYDALVFDIDRRDSVRKNSITIVEGTPNSTPQYPAMINEELHKQYPFAYVLLNPGNSEIISAENITYNVGKSTCPLVTGPLEVISDDNFFQQMNAKFETFKNDLDEEFTVWFDGIKDLIEDLNIGNINLVNSVDNVTIEWPADTKKLQVKDRGITKNKLSFDLQSIIGVLDPTGWSFQDYYDYTNSLSFSGEEETFVNQYLTATVVGKWTAEQISSYYDILKSNTSKNVLWNGISWEKQPLSGFRALVEKFGSGKYSSMIGKKIQIDLGDTYGVHNFIVIGVNHDTLSSGGSALLTFQCEDIVTQYSGLITLPSGKRFTATPIYAAIQNIFSETDPSITNIIKEVVKYQFYTNGDKTSVYGKEAVNSKYWLASSTELGLRTWAAGYESRNLGTVYDYWSARSYDTKNYIKKYNNAPTGWGTWYDYQIISYGDNNQQTAWYDGVNEVGNDHASSGSGGDVSFNFGQTYSSRPVGTISKENVSGVSQSSEYYHIMYLVPCFCV